jgi:hypothetical protein
MGSRTGVEARLRKAADLGAVLAVAYEAFEGMLSLLRQHQDRTGELFAVFVMAAASAADGRDAVAAAPSLPRCRKRTEQLTPPTDGDADADRVADELAALSQLCRSTRVSSILGWSRSLAVRRKATCSPA